MKHLFVYNPHTDEGYQHSKALQIQLNELFETLPGVEYDTHISRWSRDATGFVRRYVLGARELVRVYACGDDGLLYEVVNAVAGLPNAQVGAIPIGNANDFVRYFGGDCATDFLILRNQILSSAIPVDLIRCNNNYAINYCSVGLDSIISQTAGNYNDNPRFHSRYIYPLAAARNLFSESRQVFKLDIDGTHINDSFTSILVANGSSFAKTMTPAPNAIINDGEFDLFLCRFFSFFSRIKAGLFYLNGNHSMMEKHIETYKGKRLTVESDEAFPIAMDGEVFYDLRAEFELIPAAIDFICPINKVSKNNRFIEGDRDE